MLLHINPTRQRGKRTGSLARASGWYMTFFAAGVIGVSAKRRERYYDKQAMAIAGMYERLARLVYAVDQLHISDDPEVRRLVLEITT